MKKNRKVLIIATVTMALIFSLYIQYNPQNADVISIKEKAIESLKWDKKSQLDLPFLESLTRHFLALVH